jgi:RHS repeat-associated protein
MVVKSSVNISAFGGGCNCGDNNQMTEAGADDFTFDHFGNTTGITGKEAFTYNFDNCMTERENLLTDSVDQHEYDGDMRRMRSKLNNAANWTNFIHDELTENLLCEYTLVSGTYTVKALNTYGTGLISSNRQSTIRYFHFDGLGTTYHLSDTSQNVTDSYTYNAFGVPLSASGSSVNPYRYVGQWGYYDDGAMGSSSEMLLLGVRYYWPAYARFSTWDASIRGNLYSYAGQAPHTLIDPSGADVGRCDVILCSKRTLRGNVTIHRFVCVRGPNGGCAGGLYPGSSQKTGGDSMIGPGTIGDTNEPCRSGRRNGVYYDCGNVLTNRTPDDTKCKIAAAICECMRLAIKSPPRYDFPVSTCYTFHQTLIECACKRLSGDAKADCMWILSFRT